MDQGIKLSAIKYYQYLQNTTKTCGQLFFDLDKKTIDFDKICLYSYADK